MRPRIEECSISRPSSAGSGGVEVKQPSLAHVLPSTVRRHRSSSTPRRDERSLPPIRFKSNTFSFCDERVQPRPPFRPSLRTFSCNSIAHTVQTTMAVDYLFDPQTLAAATAADDTTRADQLSVDDGSCKYRLRPLCLTDFGRGTQRELSGRARSSFKHT